jgi:hypothetical protein
MGFYAAAVRCQQDTSTTCNSLVSFTSPRVFVQLPKSMSPLNCDRLYTASLRWIWKGCSHNARRDKGETKVAGRCNFKAKTPAQAYRSILYL